MKTFLWVIALIVFKDFFAKGVMVLGALLIRFAGFVEELPPIISFFS